MKPERYADKKAVIFDMDGVIVDSMPYHYIAWYEALRPYGVRVSCFDVYSKEGEQWEKSLRHFFRRAKIVSSRKTLKKIFKERQLIFRRYFKRYIFKDAKELLACLKAKGYLLGLVTGTPYADIEKVLPKAICDMFDAIVAGDHVKKGKPHPDPYLKAAKILNVKPSECIVVENAPYGIESAKKAGMYCIAVSTSLPRGYLKEADLVVDELADMAGHIETACVCKDE